MRLRRPILAAAMVIATGGSLLVCATPAHAEIGTDPARWCGNSEYIQDIKIQEWATGEFKIKVKPTHDSRYASSSDATQSMWSAVQNCVPGLYGTLADSVWDQLQCHQELALLKDDPALIGDPDGYVSGETYDLESWHDPFIPDEEPANATRVGQTSNRRLMTYVATHCGNTLNEERHPTGLPSDEFRPDGRNPGWLDITPPTNVA